jgi:hypothetical protein
MGAKLPLSISQKFTTFKKCHHSESSMLWGPRLHYNKSSFSSKLSDINFNKLRQE